MENRKLIMEVDPADVQDLIWSADELLYTLNHLLELSGTSDTEALPTGSSETAELPFRQQVEEQLANFASQAELCREYLSGCLEEANTLLDLLASHEAEIEYDTTLEDLLPTIDHLLDVAGMLDEDCGEIDGLLNELDELSDNMTSQHEQETFCRG